MVATTIVVGSIARRDCGAALLALCVLLYPGASHRDSLPATVMNKLVTRSSTVLMVAIAAACARHSGDVAGLLVGQPPVFETRIEIATGSEVHSDYRVADFNGDGVLDMAVISLTGELRVLIGNGASFVLGQQLQIDGLPIWMAGGDFDGDGDEDLVIVRSDANETNLWLNDGQGGFSIAGTLTDGAGALAVQVGDWTMMATWTWPCRGLRRPRLSSVLVMAWVASFRRRNCHCPAVALPSTLPLVMPTATD